VMIALEEINSCFVRLLWITLLKNLQNNFICQTNLIL
jgi:hypothetical protein